MLQTQHWHFRLPCTHSEDTEEFKHFVFHFSGNHNLYVYIYVYMQFDFVFSPSALSGK